MMRHWREREFERHLSPTATRTNLALWGWLVQRPQLYRFATGIAARALSLWAGKKNRLSKAPLASGWTEGRDLPAPEGETFFAQYAKRERERLS
jgi:L-lactate dehydrogenase complex protein LldF